MSISTLSTVAGNPLLQPADYRHAMVISVNITAVLLPLVFCCSAGVRGRDGEFVIWGRRCYPAITMSYCWAVTALSVLHRRQLSAGQGLCCNCEVVGGDTPAGLPIEQALGEYSLA